MATSRSGRNWTKEARRSAPARIPNLDVTGSGVEPRQRHAVRKQADSRRHWDLSADDVDADGRLRKRARQAQTPETGLPGEEDEDEDDGVFSPVSRSHTKGLSRAGTGDIDIDDDDSDSSYNSFNLSLKKKALFEDEEPSGLLSVNTFDLGRAASTSSLGGDERDKFVVVYRVYRSHYEGDLFHDGNLTAEMTTGTNRKLFQHELSKPLFRWVHVENPTMMFNSFTAVVQECPWLDAAEKTSAINVFRVARQNSDRSLRMPPGKQGSYLEPEFYEEIVDQTVFRGFRSRHQKTETIRWITIPYFVVGEKKTTSRKSSKIDDSELSLPPVPFLDTGYVREGKYFQAAQVWCLMIGNGLIITCTRRSIDELPGDLVHAKTLPPADPQKRNVGDRAPVIIVSDGGLRTWLLPVDKCKTWPEFAANFAELGVDFFDGWDLMYQDANITKRDWPKVIELAEKASIRLTLVKSADDEEDEDWEEESSSDEARQEALSRQASQSDPAISGLQVRGHAPSAPVVKQPLLRIESDESSDTEDFQAFHVFTLLATNLGEVDSSDHGTSNGSTKPKTPQKLHNLMVDPQVLKNDCDETNTYLFTYNRRRGESIAWLQCPTSWPDKIQKYLSTLDTSPTGDLSFNLDHSKAHLFKAAQLIFTFFYPADYKHLVTQRYWGAIDRIIESEDAAKSPSRFKQMVHNARHLAAVVEDLKEELFSKRTPAYNQTNVPHEFIQAWLMILMYFVLFPTDEARRSSTYLKRARALLTQGKMKVIQRLQTVSLRDREAVSPLGVATLLMGQLLQDNRGQPIFPDRHRLASLYWRDIQALVNTPHPFLFSHS